MTLAEAIQSGDLLATAQAYLAAGLSVIPVHADGSKAPKHTAWTRYGDTLPTQAELAEWFGRSVPTGIGIPGGPASGNLSVLDFETADVWDAWLARLSPEERDHADRCPLARTPGGGAHLYVRLELPTRGVTLAERPNGTDNKGRQKVKTLIETRAHGEQVLAPGCPDSCHPLNKPYRWERTAWVGGGVNHVVPLDVWIDWTEHAAALTQVERKAPERKLDNRPRGPVSADDPGTDFSHRGTWEETGLFAAGWQWVRDYGDDRGTVRRPGKSDGLSGTLGMVSSRENGWPLFHCFTSNGSPFEARANYDRFGVYARLEHGADFKAASKALRERGYGKQDRPAPSVTWRTTTENVEAGKTGRGFKWASELAAPSRVDDWIWEGYLPRGAVTLLSALWKVGKTTLLSHLLKACGVGGDFLGKTLKASRVLYVSEEGERHWVRRRDGLELEDNVGFYLQPFPTRPDTGGWVGFVKQLKEDVEAHGFDLVVFDTLAKLWPVNEENDAGAVDAALMPLWDITRAGAGVLLIHHLRKSGGGEYTGSRGSGALSAFPDILVELTRFDAGDSKSKKRVLRAKGRYEETPDELVIELVNGEYVHVPDLPTGPDSGEPTPVMGETTQPVPPAPTDGIAGHYLLDSGDTVALPATLATLGEEERVVALLELWPGPWMQSHEIRDALRAAKAGFRDEDVVTHIASLVGRKQVVVGGKLRSKTTPRVFALASRSTPGCQTEQDAEGDIGQETGGPEVIPFPSSGSNVTQGRSETTDDEEAA